MFSFITKNWRGRPLTSYRVIVELVAATTTETGLRILAEWDQSYYPTGVPSHRRRTGRLAPHRPRLAPRVEP